MTPLTAPPVPEQQAPSPWAVTAQPAAHAQWPEFVHDPPTQAGAFAASPPAGRSPGDLAGNGFSPAPYPATALDQPPATIQYLRTDAELAATGGRHRGGRPSDADAATSHRRSRRGLILGIALGIVVLAGAGAAAAIALLQHHHHHTPQATAAPTKQPEALQPLSPTGSASSSAPTSGPSASGSASPIVVGPAGWTLPKPIDQQAYHNDDAVISSVSCVTAVECFAVDGSGDILTSTAVNSWGIVTTDASAQFTSISCAAAQFCAAVDNSGDVILFSGGNWSDPVSIDSGSQLTSISCATSTFCVAVDNDGNEFTFTGSATQWSRVTVDPNQDTISSVSCPTVSFCAAVDQSGNVYTYDGSSWSSSADNIDNGYELTQVSCPSAAFCAAIDNNGNAAIMTNGNWSVGSMPSTATAISCPAAGYCVAVDNSGGALVYEHGSWSKEAKIDGNNNFEAISCAAVNTCTATDQYDNVMYYMPTSSG